jgi:ATP synthase protein I
MNDSKWRQGVERDARRLKDAERGRRSLFAQTVFLGTLPILFLAPLMAGAYLGRWLDSLAGGYTTRWTMSFIGIGLGLGIFNVYQFIRKHW